VEAEAKTEAFKKIILTLQRDLNKTMALAEEVSDEKSRLEEKAKIIRTSKKISPKASPLIEESFLKSTPSETVAPISEDGKILNAKKKKRLRGFGPAVGFSSGLVREIYRLADLEMNVNEIVQKTQLSRAEVQLILNLRDNRFTTPN
jgi:DNA-binding transcriptional regulator GbsR (MarR family)